MTTNSNAGSSPFDRKARPLAFGHRVKHNYKNGHGYGRITHITGDGSQRFAYLVIWDGHKEAMPYTCNDDNQEIVAA